MSSDVGNLIKGTRRAHDSEASRAALLEAASELFDEVGYDRATTREIGARAGVDASLIARYFGSKEDLFLATLGEPDGADAKVDYEPVAFLGLILERWDDRGHSPISRALASPGLSDKMREQVREVVRRRVLKQLAQVFRDRGAKNPELRAELLVAVAIGVGMTRGNATLEGLASATRQELLDLLRPLLEA